MTASAHLDATRPLPLSGPPSRGLWANVWRQLIHKKRAVFGLIVIALFTFVAILAPLLAPHDPLELGFGRVYLMVLPGAVLSSGMRRCTPVSSPAARIIPFDSTPMSMAGFRLATTTTCLPKSSSFL